MFISHDLNVIEYVSSRVLVMYLGEVVETGTAEALSQSPKHPYTQALFASAPSMDPDRRMDRPPLSGDPPNPIDPPSGCRFRTRCTFAMPQCAAGAARAARDGPGSRRRLLSLRGRARDYNGGWTLIVFVASRPLTAGPSLPPSSGMVSSASATTDSA